MKTEHTQGPWKVLEHARGRGKTCVTTTLESPVQAIICEIDTRSVGTNDEIRLANARLIAVAPELLEEARLSITYLELSLKAHDYLTTLEHERLARLRALVSKAEGNA